MTRLKIGISACFMHPDTQRATFAYKTLHYLEESIAHWVMSADAVPVLIPSPAGNTARGNVGLSDYAEWLDGLVLHGGADVWPGSYGETPLKEQWAGDRLRDDYEKALVAAFVAQGKPVFGVCRGLQLMNVAFGGTLYQDLATQRPSQINHRDALTYDTNFHQLDIEPNSWLAGLCGAQRGVKINSIHHQGIKDLAPGFTVQARCTEDGTIEAIRGSGASYLAAVQWHPEFHTLAQNVLDDAPLLNDFLAAASTRRAQPSTAIK
jgi:putative glutamine amidotransferase